MLTLIVTFLLFIYNTRHTPSFWWYSLRENSFFPLSMQFRSLSLSLCDLAVSLLVTFHVSATAFHVYIAWFTWRCDSSPFPLCLSHSAFARSKVSVVAQCFNCCESTYYTAEIFLRCVSCYLLMLHLQHSLLLLKIHVTSNISNLNVSGIDLMNEWLIQFKFTIFTAVQLHHKWFHSPFSSRLICPLWQILVSLTCAFAISPPLHYFRVNVFAYSGAMSLL